MVVGQVVWPRAWQFCHVPTCSGVHREDRGDVSVELGLLTCTRPLNNIDSPLIHSIRRQASFDDAL